jgi:hypothetical protein
MHGTQTVVLTEAAEFNGEVFERCVSKVAVEGRYWTEFERTHPLADLSAVGCGAVTIHGLFGELGMGTVTASTLQLELGVSALNFGLGLTIMLLGSGLQGVGRSKEDDPAPVAAEHIPIPEPVTVENHIRRRSIWGPSADPDLVWPDGTLSSIKVRQLSRFDGPLVSSAVKGL